MWCHQVLCYSDVCMDIFNIIQTVVKSYNHLLMVVWNCFTDPQQYKPFKVYMPNYIILSCYVYVYNYEYVYKYEHYKMMYCNLTLLNI